MTFDRPSNLHQQMEFRREKRIIDLAYKKAQEVLASEESIDPQQFDNFDPATIARDVEYVKRMEAVFAQQNNADMQEAKQFGLILEAMIHEQAELNDWLGEEVTTVKASRFDDIANGIDSIAEFHRDGGVSHLALAIDVTHGDPTRKLIKIREEIDAGRLSEIKYFASSDGNFQGSLKKVPRVIVGADRKTIIDLAQLWTENKKTDLAKHPVQLQLLDEIILQLRTFINYAETNGKDSVIDIYRKQLRLVESIRQSPRKLELAQQEGAQDYQNNDRMFGQLTLALRSF